MCCISSRTAPLLIARSPVQGHSSTRPIERHPWASGADVVGPSISPVASSRLARDDASIEERTIIVRPGPTARKGLVAPAARQSPPDHSRVVSNREGGFEARAGHPPVMMETDFPPSALAEWKSLHEHDPHAAGPRTVSTEMTFIVEYRCPRCDAALE